MTRRLFSPGAARLAAVAAAALTLLGLALAYAAATPGGCPPLAYRDRLYDATFVGDKEAWVAGYPGLILHTTDGGATWNRQCGVTGQALFAVDFADPQHGWIVGRAGIALSTADGGKTWRQSTPVCPEELLAVDFVNAERGWAVGYKGRVARTVDGGQTWQASTLEAMASAGLNGLHFFDAERGFVVGEYPSWEAEIDPKGTAGKLSNMFMTKDGGATWSLVKTGSTFTLHDVLFADDKRGWACGARGTLLATDDGGATWRTIPTGQKAHLLRMALAPDALWIAGTEGVLLRVVGGQAATAPIQAYSWLSSVAFAPGGAGLVVGGRGTLATSADRGATWRLFPLKH
jgi:photosystem II stability/assembly factor-like uncharacterized protein